MKYVVDLEKAENKGRMIRMPGASFGGPGTGKRGKDLKKRKPRADAAEMHKRDLESENWHTRTIASMKDKSEESLRFIIKDATEAAEAGESIGNPKVGQYRDEAHYANMELRRRGLQKSEVKPYIRTRKGKMERVKGHNRALLAATAHQLGKDNLVPKKQAIVEAKRISEEFDDMRRNSKMDRPKFTMEIKDKEGNEHEVGIMDFTILAGSRGGPWEPAYEPSVDSMDVVWMDTGIPLTEMEKWKHRDKLHEKIMDFAERGRINDEADRAGEAYESRKRMDW